MAGSAMGDGDEAVQLNVTPLIDIIFCLCIFFMCSFHFKQLQGKLDSWLPKDKGNQAGGLTTAMMDEIRIIISKDSTTNGTKMSFGARVIGVLPQSTGENAERERILTELETLIKQQYDDYRNAGKNDASVIIDGEPYVPWKDVLAVLDRCKKNNIDKVEFAQPMPTMPVAPKAG